MVYAHMPPPHPGEKNLWHNSVKTQAAKATPSID